MLTLYKMIGRLLRALPKFISVKNRDMEAKFFVPINCHYISDDLIQIKKGLREPRLYEWLNKFENHSVFFDIGTSYGQEVSLASSFKEKGIRVIGFDCNLYHAHFCCLNKALNSDRFEFVFAVVSDASGIKTKIKSNSDTHIPHLHKKNVQYSYDVMSITLDDYCIENKVYPTYLKIDVDGNEGRVLNGAKMVLSHSNLVEIFIEIDFRNQELVNFIKGFGFEVAWQEEKRLNCDFLFIRSNKTRQV